MHYNIIAGNLFKCYRVPSSYFWFKFFFIILTWWLTAVWCFAYGFGWEGGTGNMCESESGSLMLKFLLRFVSKWLRFGLFYHHHYHLYHGLSSAKCLPVWLRTLLRTFHSLFHFAHHSHFANKVDEKWQFLSWINCDIQATKSIFEFVSVEKNSVTITKMNMDVRLKFCGLKTFGVPSTSCDVFKHFTATRGSECLLHAISDRGSLENSKLSNLTLSPFSVKWSLELILLLQVYQHPEIVVWILECGGPAMIKDL